MKGLLFILSFTVIMATDTRSQSAYALNFVLPTQSALLECNSFFVTYGNGAGFARLRISNHLDSTLINMEITQQLSGVSLDCSSDERIYFQLKKTQVIFGNDTITKLPGYFCFKKNDSTGFYEPLGYGYDLDGCNTMVTKFIKTNSLEHADLTSDFVLSYFTKQEKFYSNLFVAKTRALTINELNVKLHLLVVANTFDDSIGKACQKDMARAIKFFSGIKDFLGIKFEFDTVSGKKYNRKNLENGIKNLANAAPNDIIVFYYSGHGFRQKGDTRRPPYIDLRPNYDENPNNLNSMSIADIYQTISAMPARFKLVLSDCCNDLSKTYNAKAKPPGNTKGNLSWSTQNCADLFLNAKRSSILATAAEPGQLATCNDNFGGFFSYSFLNAIENQLNYFKSNPTWEKIITDTKSNTKWMADHTYCPVAGNPKKHCYQIPYAEIN